MKVKEVLIMWVTTVIEFPQKEAFLSTGRKYIERKILLERNNQ